jgi:hypothetical protein
MATGAVDSIIETLQQSLHGLIVKILQAILARLHTVRFSMPQPSDDAWPYWVACLVLHKTSSHCPTGSHLHIVCSNIDYMAC